MLKKENQKQGQKLDQKQDQKQESDLEKIARLRGVSKITLNSLDRNIRACYPKYTEEQLQEIIKRTLLNNLDSCK